MDDYKPNSDRFKNEQRTGPKPTGPVGPPPEEKKKLKPVVSKTTKTKKSNSFMSNAKNIAVDFVLDKKDTMIKDVIIPGVLDCVSGIWHSLGDTIFGGGGYRGGYGGYRGSTPGSRVQYGKFFSGNQTQSQPMSNKDRYDLDYDGIIIPDKQEAEELLTVMRAMIDQEGEVSVGEFFELAGIRTQNYVVANNYGWKNLRAAALIPRGREGWEIRLPRAHQLEN